VLFSKTIVAPQPGQMALFVLTPSPLRLDLARDLALDSALDPAHADALGADEIAEALVPRPFAPRTAAVQVERREAALGERVASDVRFGEQQEARHAAGAGEALPHRIAQRMELELLDEDAEDERERIRRAQTHGITAESVDEPS
jgi:hypothetical protein